MAVTIRKLKRVTVIAISYRVDSNNARELEDALAEVTAGDRYRIVVDLKDTDYISARGLRALISSRDVCRRWNRGDLRLCNLPPRIKDVFDLAGLTEKFTIYPDAIGAVGSF